MPESLNTAFMRWYFKFFPCYAGTGAKVTYIARDWKEVRVELPLSRRTRNYVGTIFGGSLYASVDPFYMIMLIQILGPKYVVWDKAAAIRFKKPGKGTLYARFSLDDAEIDAIRAVLETEPSVDRKYLVELKDAEGVVHAAVEKVVYIRKADAAQSS
ncbi:MAG: DUF4442 domain-containing protein [Deltaproteobacteria bacterium]|nr:DUF4442 domain-containing protein [Deltaproteobacteria bacterium]